MAIFDKPAAEPVDVLGEPLECHVCKHDRFRRRRAQLNTAVCSFFNLDWANKSATCVVCDRCGYIHWFLE
jgi:hypothetical protein